LDGTRERPETSELANACAKTRGADATQGRHYASVLAALAFDAHAYVGEVRVLASHEPMHGGDYTGLAVSEA
jgi:hypothetical protein